VSEDAACLQRTGRATVVSRRKALDVDQLSAHLPEAAARMREWGKAASEDDLELIFQALQVQVTASREKVQVAGSVPALLPKEQNLVTTARTSA